MVYDFINRLYGQVRGYDRWNIYREVRNNSAKPGSELAAYTEALFVKRVEDAMARFPLYAEKVKAAGGSRDNIPGIIASGGIPVWTRADQRILFDSSKGPPLPGAFIHSTGGSTGVPVSFYVTRESYEWRLATSERGYSWAGAEEGRKSFYVWGTPVRPEPKRIRLKKQLHHTLQQRKYFNSFDFGDERKMDCCRQINRFMPESLVGYAGNLVELARFVRENRNALQWRVKTIVTAAEGLFPGQRELLSEYLGDEVFLSYGSREFMLIGMECRIHAGYHISSDNLKVEIVDEKGLSVKPGVAGRIVVTDLHNQANPFVRYEIGDHGTMTSERCSCGLPFPLLASVDGRTREVIYSENGRKITALLFPHIMKEFRWIEGYQIYQGTKGVIVIRFISRDEPRAEWMSELIRNIQARVGNDLRISFERVANLSRNRSGKVPIVVGPMSLLD